MRTILSKVEGMLGRARLWYWLASILATLATSSLFGWLAQRVAIIALTDTQPLFSPGLYLRAL
jgi:hypothetical protein